VVLARLEIDESKFGRCKYQRGHAVKVQWVSGGIERESGKTFLVPVTDRTADTLMTLVIAWIEPGTTVISDCWAAYQVLEAHGYRHRTVYHSIQSLSLMSGVGLIRTRMKARDGGLKLSSTLKAVRGNTYTIFPITCSQHDAVVKT
jgi:transposase-like protein